MRFDYRFSHYSFYRYYFYLLSFFGFFKALNTHLSESIHAILVWESLPCQNQTLVQNRT